MRTGNRTRIGTRAGQDSPLLCHLDDGRLPLQRQLPGVRIHRLAANWRRWSRRLAGVGRALEAGGAADLPGGDGDGGEAGSVVGDEGGDS